MVDLKNDEVNGWKDNFVIWLSHLHFTALSTYSFLINSSYECFVSLPAFLHGDYSDAWSTGSIINGTKQSPILMCTTRILPGFQPLYSAIKTTFNRLTWTAPIWTIKKSLRISTRLKVRWVKYGPLSGCSTIACYIPLIGFAQRGVRSDLQWNSCLMVIQFCAIYTFPDKGALIVFWKNEKKSISLWWLYKKVLIILISFNQ